MAEQGVKAGDDLAEMKPASVTAYGSGNAAQVYFDLFPRKITLAELNDVYPNMIDVLIQHEGIGMVVGYADDMTPVALGKVGQRHPHTGEVVGEDPVAPYVRAEGHGAGTLETCIWQLQRVMDFPHAGDLWLISTVYPDGTVAALKELIGNHGGLGGEQTDELGIFPVAVFTLKASKLEEKQGRILKLVGGMLMPTLAIIMSWCPISTQHCAAQSICWRPTRLPGRRAGTTSPFMPMRSPPATWRIALRRRR